MYESSLPSAGWRMQITEKVMHYRIHVRKTSKTMPEIDAR